MESNDIEIEDGQIRIQLSDKDSTVFNKKLIFDKVRFKEPVHLSYERHIKVDGKEIIEHYTNDERHMYFVKETKGEQTVTEGFSDCGTIFFREVRLLDLNNREVIEEWVWDIDDVEHYQRHRKR
ncbi:hypothetical protein OAL15_02480 [Flavobacteriales bacterium]|nr:hypothetical protein [Flavobacteriales bacterium]